jgi:hypothetical protein
MTVTEIVNDLLKYKMITSEAANVLLSAEIKASLLDIQTVNCNKNQHTVFQPYTRVPNTGTTNPYYVSTTTNDCITGSSNTSTDITAGANELLKTK